MYITKTLKLRNKKCYLCSEAGINREHVPALAFFPEGYRENLITVRSCETHNNATSLDDEYVRGVIVTCLKNNKVAYEHWSNGVRRSFFHSPGLFFQTFKQKEDDAYFHDRARIDKVIMKIAHGLYYHEFKTYWEGNPKPFYEDMLFDDGKSDIEVRLPTFKNIPWTEAYKGANQAIFKYQFLYGRINGSDNYSLKMIFYEGFTVFAIPNL